MGFFDWFRKPRPVPTSEPAGPAIAVPCAARIETFDAADGVGSLRTSTGEVVRFGRSACRGFEPVAGVRVEIAEVTVDRRGVCRARSLSLDPADRDYDRALAERDAELGIKKPLSLDDAVGTTRAIGWIAVLLPAEVPHGPQAQREWAQRLGLEAAGITTRTEEVLSFVVGKTTVNAFLGPGPYPAEQMDLTQVDASFDTGRFFLGLSLGVPDMVRETRGMLGRKHPDPWGPAGDLRNLSRLVVALLREGTGVVLPRAGDLVVDRESFVAWLGDLEAPECKPFGAWLDLAVSSELGMYATFGMAAFGLPDVLTPVDAGDPADRTRAHEAVLFAAYRMIRENRELAAGEVVEVPVGVRIGAWPISKASSDVRGYTASFRDACLVLEPGEWRARRDSNP